MKLLPVYGFVLADTVLNSFMDVSVIYSPFHSCKTQFILKLLCSIHGLLLPAVIFSPVKKVSVPFSRIM